MKAKPLESFIRRAANLVGLDISRYKPELTEPRRIVTMLETHDVDLVIDVGANTGQYARSIRNAGYKGKILSFEPLTHAHRSLASAARADAGWEVAPRLAIGSFEGEINLHVSANSVSSSLLNMLESHSTAAPGSRYVAVETVSATTLDSFFRVRNLHEQKPFLKIDTQGYEDRVLDGAANLLKHVRGVQIELSMLPLYEGQALFDAMLLRLQEAGFDIWAIWPGFSDKKSGRMLQVDVVMFRNHLNE